MFNFGKERVNKNQDEAHDNYPLNSCIRGKKIILNSSFLIFN